MRCFRFACIGLLALGIVSCRNSLPLGSGTVTVDLSAPRQSIDGFGGSNAWTGLPGDPATSAKVVQLLFSKTNGIGLTILRNRIPFREQPGSNDDKFINKNPDYTYKHNPDGTFSLNWDNWDLAQTKALISAVKALGSDADGLTLFSTPWTPPNNSTTNWKTGVPDASNYPQVGGSLDPAHYADYADVLADYANGFAANMGIALGALSIQNEPNFTCNYESCSWNSSQIQNFLDAMQQEFQKKGVSSSLSVLAPEDMNFKEDLILPSLSDAVAGAFLSIVGVHQYDRNASDFAARWLPTVKSAGKRLWMTEVSDTSANDGSIADGIYLARMVHADMTTAEVNAFCYWWLWTGSGDTSTASLVNLNTAKPSGSQVLDNKRLYALGQFSRFVRPGWVRLQAESDPTSQVEASVYRNPGSKEVAVVLINYGSTGDSVQLGLSGASSFASLKQWRTSATEELAPLGALGVSASSATVALPAQSITTVYGTVNS
jgi:O-glycosyl hydrolase